MKYCQNCGNELNDEAKFCPDCGVKVEPLREGKQDSHPKKEDYKVVALDESEETQKRNDGNQSLGIAAIVFMWLGVLMTIFDFFTYREYGISISQFAYFFGVTNQFSIISGLLPLIWQIPMTIIVIHFVTKRKKVHPAFSVAAMIFCNLVAGVLLLCYKPKTTSK